MAFRRKRTNYQNITSIRSVTSVRAGRSKAAARNEARLNTYAQEIVGILTPYITSALKIYRRGKTSIRQVNLPDEVGCIVSATPDELVSIFFTEPVVPDRIIGILRTQYSGNEITGEKDPENHYRIRIVP